MRELAQKWAVLSAGNDLVTAEVRRQVAVAEQRQKLLMRSENRLQQIIDATGGGLFVMDREGCITEWSHTAETMFGPDSTAAVGRPIQELFQPCELSAAIHERLACPGPEGETSFAECDAVTAEGRQLNTELLLLTLRDGNDLRLQAFVHDVSERRNLHLQLIHARKMEAVGQLAAGIAHEINTPTQFVGDNLRFLCDSFQSLAPILDVAGTDQCSEPAGQLELLRSAAQAADLAWLRDEIPRAIDQSIEGIGRIAAITRAMKEFSHPGTVEMSLVDLRHAVENTLVVCRNEWKYVAEIQTDYDPELPAVECLPGELNQVILNIVVNAAQAIGEVSDVKTMRLGLITISTRKDADRAEIRVSDNGPGIPPAIRNRIFEPFFTTKEVGKGTGQGLAIAHAVIVEKHGGSIHVESREGQGTTFIIRIPIHHNDTLNETVANEEKCAVCG